MADQSFSVTGKNVCVTGAGGSIGTQIAVLFAKNGANLLLCDSSSIALDGLRSFLDLHGPFDGHIWLEICDITKEESVVAVMGILDEHGGVDVQINNAGIFHAEDGNAIESTEKAWDLTYNVNIKGTWICCKHAVQSMLRHGKRGSIINMCSVAGLIDSATAQIAYTASKGAVLAFTRELAIVHARDGIRFNCICPGPLNTPMMQDYLGANQTRRFRREIHLPQGRFGEPIEVASSALFLSSDASAFVNAQELVVDGGLTKAYVTPEGPVCGSVVRNFLTAPENTGNGIVVNDFHSKAPEKFCDSATSKLTTR